MALTNIAGTVTNVVETVSAVTGASRLSRLADRACDYLLARADRLIPAALLLIIGFAAARWIGNIISRALEKQNLDPPVRLLLVRLSRLLIFGLALTCALEVAQFQMTALITGIGVLGVGLGFGMQGLLSNMVAGLTIIFTRPFRVGDYIELLGVQGAVVHIDIVSTTLAHLDYSKLIIPNHKIIGEILHNFGAVRQLTLTVGVGYQTDLKRACDLIAAVLERHPRVLRDPKPMVLIRALQDSSIVINAHPWVKLDDYLFAQSELNQAIVDALRENQIDIPFPQREIRILPPSPAPGVPSREFDQAPPLR
jgi:small conductance mechanosensitive channel